MKKVKRTAAIALFFLLLLQACDSNKGAANAEGVTLKFNLKKGKTYVYSMIMDMDSEVQGQKMDTEMEFAYTLEVLDDKDSVKTLRTTYDRLKMAMNAGAMNLNFDTDQPQKDSAVDIRSNPMGMMSNMFYAMKGKSFELKVNNRGEVLSVTGSAEMRNAMMNSLSADENVRQTMGQVFQSQFNEESIKQSFAQAFTIFPDKPVKVGDTWTKTMNMGGAASGNVNTTYKVKEINGNNVVLDLTSDLNIAQGKGTQKGTMEAQAETGLVTEASLEQNITAPMVMTTKTKIIGKEK